MAEVLRERDDELRRLRARPVLHDYSEPGFVSSGRIVAARPPLMPLVQGITRNTFVGDIVASHHMYRLPEPVSWLLVVSNPRQVQVVVIGPRTRLDLDSLPPWTTAMEAVIFRPGALATVLGVPVEELTDRTVPLEELRPAAGRALRHALEDAAGPDERLVLLEEAVAGFVRSADSAAPPVAVRIADALARRPSLPTVRELERIVGWSERQLRRQCGRDLGLAPKRYLRLLRFSRVIDHLRGARPPDWRSLALAVGYADQAHLIHEFRAFTGTTPTAFLADPVAAPALRHGAVPRRRAVVTPPPR